MKKFLSRLALFALIPAGIAAFTAVTYVFAVKQYEGELVCRNGETVLAACSSHFEYGIDPARWPAVKNLSSAGLSPAVWRVKTLDAVRVNGGRIKKALVDVNPLEALAPGGPEPVPGYLQFQEYAVFWLMHPELRRDEPLAIDPEIAFLRKAPGMFRHAVKSVFTGKPPKHTLAGKFTPAAGTLAALQDDERMLRTERETRQRLACAVNPLYARRLAEMCDAFRAAGVEPALLLMPEHMDARALYPDGRIAAFEGWLDAFAAERRLRVIDYRTFGIPDEGWRDWTHLNARGAALFTERLAAEAADHAL